MIQPRQREEVTAEFSGSGTALTSGGLDAVSETARLGLPEIWSVISVETSGCGFLPDRRPKLLFERHVFHDLTNGRFDNRDPDISQPTAGGYGMPGAHQYDRLAAAIQLDRNAALQSASWGLGQVMGENSKAAGFADVEEMVEAMVESEDRQLLAMATFITANGMGEPLTTHDWTGFARRYNGPDFAANDYPGKLQHFYQRYARWKPPRHAGASGANIPHVPGVCTIGRGRRAGSEHGRGNPAIPAIDRSRANRRCRRRVDRPAPGLIHATAKNWFSI